MRAGTFQGMSLPIDCDTELKYALNFGLLSTVSITYHSFSYLMLFFSDSIVTFLAS